MNSCQLERLLARQNLESPKAGESCLEEVQNGAPLIGYKIYNQDQPRL